MRRQIEETREAVQVILQVVVVMGTQVGIAVATIVVILTDIAAAMDPATNTILHHDIPVTDLRDITIHRAITAHRLISV